MAIDKLLRQLAARVTTTSVADTVDRRLALGIGAEALLAKLHTRAFTDTLHIEIDADDSDGARAERIAGAFGDVMQERQAAAMADVAPQERVNVNVLDRPTSARPAGPQTRSVALGGALLGLLVGFVLVFFLDYIDETFRSSRDVAARLGVPVLGVVPGFRAPSGGRAEPAPTAAPGVVADPSHQKGRA
jgi:capsular polysaccharide biosynthesis protein